MADALNLVLVTVDSLRRDALGCLAGDSGSSGRQRGSGPVYPATLASSAGRQ